MNSDQLAEILDKHAKWLRVPGFEHGYEVCECGAILGLRGRLLRQDIRRDGYAQVVLYGPGRRREPHSMKVHRIVASAFIPNPNGLPLVNHLDGDKQNNHVSNLEWCDAARNNAHAYEIGLNRRPIGERHGSAKLTEKSVVAIRCSRDSSYELAMRYGVSPTAIQKVRRGDTWRELGWPVDESAESAA